MTIVDVARRLVRRPPRIEPVIPGEDLVRRETIRRLMTHHDPAVILHKVFTEMRGNVKLTGTCWACGAEVESLTEDPPAWYCTKCQVTWMRLTGLRSPYGMLGPDTGPHP